MIEDLLDSTATAAGKVRLEPTEVDLVQTVRSVIEQNEPAARAKNLVVESNLSLTAGVVIADAMRIRQVVWNLLSNAVKFTPEGGRVSVVLEAAPERVTLHVQDNGPGVPDALKPKLFSRFVRGEAGAGAGLGLSIVQRVVELHGGTVSLADAHLGGLDVGVMLPRQRPGALVDIARNSPGL